MITRIPLIVAITVANLPLTQPTQAGCVTHGSENAAVTESQAIAEVHVSSSVSFSAPDGTIQTRVALATLETFKGTLPGQFEIKTPGGMVGPKAEIRSDSLSLKVGKRYVLLFDPKGDGTWTARPHHIFKASETNRKKLREHVRKRTRAESLALTPETDFTEIVTDLSYSGIPGSRLNATGYTEFNGVPGRFTTCDSGEPIPYLIDVDPSKLPTGMTVNGAIAAVAECLAVWSNSSSVKFRFEGTQSFGMAASSVTTQDRRLRIQLHDNFNVINGAAGIGGGAVSQSPSSGGRVGLQAFYERIYSFVVMESTSNMSFLLNTNNFKRVLTHEIGHALGLGHSSEDANEPDAILKAATMYYSASHNSAGATIQAYDVDRVQYGYPMNNTPPFTVDRYLEVVTAPNNTQLPAVLGVNRIQLRAYDRQGTPLTVALLGSSGPGSFSLVGDILSFAPNYTSGPRLSDGQIEAGSSYGSATFQFSDGVNLSRAATCRIIGLTPDLTPADGLPDGWMNANFGTTATGTLGSGRHPFDDPDGDGLNNRLEFFLNTSPKSASSGRITPAYNPVTRQLSFTPVRFAQHWIESSPSLSANSWSMRRVGMQSQATGISTSNFSGEAAPVREFYRVATGP